MTHGKDDSAISMALEQIIENGFEEPDTAVSILIDQAMRIECSRVLVAEFRQRPEARKNYAGGYNPKRAERAASANWRRRFPKCARSAAVVSQRP